jgi:cyclic-di-AMP phosphodiesterase PgpH
MMKAFQASKQYFRHRWNTRRFEIDFLPWKKTTNTPVLCDESKQEWTDVSSVSTQHLPPNNVIEESDKIRAKDESSETVSQALIPKAVRLQKWGYRIHPPLFLVISVTCLTATLGQRFYNQPRLDVGRPAPQTIYAPASVEIEDMEATETQRKSARIGATPILTYNPEVNDYIEKNLERVLSLVNKLRQQVDSIPYAEPSLVSSSVQRYLRQASDSEWQLVVKLSQSQGLDPSQSLPDLQRQAIAQLQNLRQVLGLEAYRGWLVQCTQIRAQYTIAIQALNLDNSLIPVNSSVVSFFDLSDQEWSQVQMGVRVASKRILTQGLPPGLQNDILTKTIRVQLDNLISERFLAIASSILLSVLESKSSLMQDSEETKRLAQQAAEAVSPVMVKVGKGDAIVFVGEKITQSQFVLLDHFRLSRREFNWLGFLGFSGAITMGVLFIRVVEGRFHLRLRRRDHVLLLLLTLSTPLLVRFGLPSTNLLAVGLLSGSFYGTVISLAITGLLLVILPFGMEIDMGYLFSSAIGGLLGGALAGRMRSREELASLGGILSLVQGGVYLAINATFSAAAGPVWFTLVTTAGLQGLVGLSWSIVALGLSPYLEHLFDLVTPIRLAELANPNRPLLKRMATEAPGTFQHTLFVATLAESAAQKLGCNVELVRAGTLYHDIGKMHDPLGFIENQMDGINKHDRLDDPWQSALIIKKHVSVGLEMARKCRLPRSVTNFIPEHQGTMLISYFYHRAQQMAQEALEQGKPHIQVTENDFRYPGPIPQSKETAIVMLADSCEAALRSLKDATPDDALLMVNRIIRSRWQDMQLSESGLTRSELMEIAAIFVQVWQRFNHKRIAYPKPIAYSGQVTSSLSSL